MQDLVNAAAAGHDAGTAKRRGLGRGLSALLGDAEATPPVGEASAGRAPRKLPIGDVLPNATQPRRRFDEDSIVALAESIEANGMLQPVLVRPHPREPGKYEIIAGERRWRAAASARLHEIPVEVRSVGDAEMFEIALVENIQREDLSAIEEADGYDRLMKEFGYTQETLAKRVGKSRAHIANTLRLGGLPEPVREMVVAGKLTAGHARALLTAPDPRALAEEAVSRSLSVRDVERLANLRKASAGMRKKGGRPSKASAAAGGKVAAKDADTSALERDLTTRLGLRVEISGGEPGTVVVHYSSLEQLDDLVQRLLA